MTKEAPFFTVFTPTFNRAGTLRRPYESLQKQTLRDFEWLVIDDGSTDNTRELVQGWQREADFPIRYVWQENASKAAAWNRAFEMAKAPFVVVIDSDDGIVPGALARIAKEWQTVKEQQKGEIACVYALAVDEHGVPMEDKSLPQDPLDANFNDIRYKYRFWREMFESLDRDILRQFPLPLIPGYRGYIPEGIMADRLALAGYKTRVIGEQLRIYYRSNAEGTEHYAVGQTSRRGLKHAPGMRLSYEERLVRSYAWAKHAPLYFLRIAAHYVRFSLHEGIGLKAQFRAMAGSGGMVLWSISLPLGVALYARDTLLRWKQVPSSR